MKNDAMDSVAWVLKDVDRYSLAVVIPVFNESPDVLRQSFVSVINQSFSNFECIVVDESTDANSSTFCKAICAADRRFKYIRPRERLGLVGSLNVGIASSTAPLVARFDADDVCLLDRFERQVRFMQEHPDVGVLGGGLELVGGEFSGGAIRRYPANHVDIEKSFNFTTPVAHPSVVVRRECLERVGGYEQKYRYAEDLDLWLRMLKHGIKFANLPEVLIKYRVRSLSRRKMHWIYNLRARLENFRAKYFWRRSFGILLIAAAVMVPDIFLRAAVRGFVIAKAK